MSNIKENDSHSKIENIEAQIASQLQQKENLKIEYQRIKNLVESGAATIQKQDDLALFPQGFINR